MADSVDELLAGATLREPLAHTDGKSGVTMERVVLDGEPYVLKLVHHADDWIMRATGDLAGRPLLVWSSGLLDQLPASIDHTVVAAARDPRHSGAPGAAILMRDVGHWLVPEGDDPLGTDQHRRFLDHMAELHATFWGWRDDVGLTSLGTRVVWFGPRLAEAEAATGGTHPVPTRLVPEGWRRFEARAPQSLGVVQALLDDPDPLVTALAETPPTFVHGDWKTGNLGSHADGRTILIDWAYGGAGPACLDIAHYICLNRVRLPESKEATLDAYREALERRGIDTAPWWERQLALCLLTMSCNFGWEKALGDSDEDRAELDWWDARAVEGAALLGEG